MAARRCARPLPTLPTPLPAVTPVGLVWRDVARPQQPIPQGGETPNDVVHSSGARGGRRGRRGGRGPTDRPADRSTTTAGDGEWRRLWPVPVPAQGQFGRRGPEPVLDPARLYQRGRQVLGRPPDARDGGPSAERRREPDVAAQVRVRCVDAG